MRSVLSLVVVLASLSLSVVQAAVIVPSPPQLVAGGYLLIDATTGDVLVDFNANQRLPPASLTKIMTSYIAAKELEKGTITRDDEVHVSVKAWRTGGSRMFIQEGSKVLLDDILRGVIIQSGNDASIALAEHIAGSEDAFVDVMNQYAALLGMNDTHYMNATGLPDENHYTTANDLSILANALISEFPEHYKMYSEREFTYNDIRQFNRNRLLGRDSSVDGMKTGHTEAAGYCLVASAKRDGMRLISVVMGASSEESRAAESQKLLTYGFRYFETASLYDADDSLKQVRVWGGQHGSVKLGLQEDLVMTLPRGSRDDLTAEIVVTGEVHAPIDEGEPLGQMRVMLSNSETLTFPLVALNGVQEAGFIVGLWDAIMLFFLKLFGGDPLAYES